MMKGLSEVKTGEYQVWRNNYDIVYMCHSLKYKMCSEKSPFANHHGKRIINVGSSSTLHCAKDLWVGIF